ncbi:MAG: ABC transporter ATP-binding protein [Lachnospiraceae bacterium]|nr:ABC transporter ATP-binding protein [Lachnospiraceae bacterium]
MSAYIEFQDVSKFYRNGTQQIAAADRVCFQAEKGEFVVIVGPSGAGKTTVLNILGGMDSCDEGHIILDGEDISTYNERQLTEYRRHDVGFVFQFYNLIQNLTARENVEIAAEICRDPLDADEVLREVGLTERRDNFPAQLSGGQQQRVSIARARAKNPSLRLSGLRTAKLDYNTRRLNLGLLYDMCRQSGKTVIVITHNQAICGMADRVIRIKNGRVQDMTVNLHPLPAEAIEW